MNDVLQLDTVISNPKPNRSTACSLRPGADAFCKESSNRANKFEEIGPSRTDKVIERGWPGQRQRGREANQMEK